MHGSTAEQNKSKGVWHLGMPFLSNFHHPFSSTSKLFFIWLTHFACEHSFTFPFQNGQGIYSRLTLFHRYAWRKLEATIFSFDHLLRNTYILSRLIMARKNVLIHWLCWRSFAKNGRCFSDDYNVRFFSSLVSCTFTPNLTWQTSNNINYMLKARCRPMYVHLLTGRRRQTNCHKNRTHQQLESSVNCLTSAPAEAILFTLSHAHKPTAKMI